MGFVTEVAEGAGGTNLSDDQIRAQLKRILSHPEFSASERRQALLRFVVDEALAGRGRALKGFTIAHAVFGRDENFDPKTDPVVRLEARRLRQDLDSYYVGPGAEDPVRIAIPKGAYVPSFDAWQSVPVAAPEPKRDEPAPAPSPGGRRRLPGKAMVLAGLAVLAVALIAGTLGLRGPRDTVARSDVAELPRVAILPFEALDPSQTARTLSLGLSSELVLKLRGFDGLRLFAPFAASDLDKVLSRIELTDVPTYVVSGQVQTDDDRVSILVQLVRAETGELVWTEQYAPLLTPGSLIDLRDEVSVAIATAIGQPYGPLSADIQAQATASDPSSLESYLCVLQAYTYRRAFSESDYAPVRTCLEATVARSPDYPEAWAMLGWLQLDAARYRFVPPEQIDAEYAAALLSAERAFALAPQNSVVLKALSSIYHHVGRYEEGERYGRMALELNPQDPDTLAQVGWRLSARGKFEEASALMEQAIQRTVDPPAWYYNLPSLQNFMQGNHDLALEQAEIAAANGGGFAWFLVTISAAALGDAEKATAAMRMLSGYPDIASDPEGFMRRHGALDEIIEEAMAEFHQAQRMVSDQDSPQANN